MSCNDWEHDCVVGSWHSVPSLCVPGWRGGSNWHGNHSAIQENNSAWRLALIVNSRMFKVTSCCSLYLGYIGSERQALLVISACYLPPHSIPQYQDIIQQLFLWVVCYIFRSVHDSCAMAFQLCDVSDAEDSGGWLCHCLPAQWGSPPQHASCLTLTQVLSHGWPQVCCIYVVSHVEWSSAYSALCRLRKQLQHLYIVHPTFWVRSMLRLARPFVRLALPQPT